MPRNITVRDVRMTNLQNVWVVFTQLLYPRTDRLEKYDLQKLAEKTYITKSLAAAEVTLKFVVFFHENANFQS